jgi:tetratricopeptide (TPR) repeat protein
MALNYWGWSGNRDDVAKVIKPGVNDPKLDFIQRGRTDLNVMPYEMVDFVNDETEYRSLSRYGGTIDLLKRLIAGGYPIIIEKGYYQRDTAGAHTWMGHYAFVTGYDDAQKTFIWQDVYVPLELCEGDTKKVGGNRQVSYDEFITGWRAFNYLFVVVYPSDKEGDVTRLLGDWNDSARANQNALNLAEQDIQSVEGIDLYFAWFNKGTSHVQLLQYGEAASAYDLAFSVYPTIPEDVRPWRMLWYQTGPYWAYFYSGRYQDVISLADLTLSTPSTGPTLEESLYWRGLAEFALGDSVNAFADMREAVRLNPNFTAGLQKLQEWGIGP